MKFIIEPINDTDCRIIGIDRSDMDGQKLTEVKIPSIIDQDGRTWNVKEVHLLIRDLTLLEIAEGVTKISGDYQNLERVSLPSTIEEIGASTFYFTEVLEHLKELPASLKRIGQCAFEKAFKFGREEDKELHILSPQISISENAFNCDARNVNRIKLVASDETIASIMGQPGALNGTAVEAINIPDGATEVYVCNCPRLKVLSIPDCVQTVRKLSEIGAEIKASAEVWKKICETEGCLSEYTPKNTELQIPEGVTELAARLLWRSSITKISIPSTVEKIGYRAFQECKSLESITFSPGSMLKIVDGGETFSKNALKEVVFPDGMTTIGEGAFSDMEYLETVTFPASMTSYGNRPFVHCKKLKEVIFLADNPATATYPDHLGKMVNWYVPDHMVPYVEEFFQKTKGKYALPDGIGAKAVKPLSKLKGGAPAAAPQKQAPKKQILTQPIRLEAFGIKAIYEFAVDEADMDMLDNKLDMSILATRYLRDKAKECSFRIVDNRRRDSTLVVEELSLETRVNSATEKHWHCTPKTTVEINFTDASNLPEDFPTNITSEVAKHGDFQNLFASRCPNYDKQLPEGAPAYLKVELNIRVRFDFMIGEKEKFNVKKISVMKDWDFERSAKRKCWRFALMYNGRYIPATAITLINGESTMGLTVSKQPDGKEVLDVPAAYEFDGIKFECEKYKAETIPFSNEILSLMK